VVIPNPSSSSCFRSDSEDEETGDRLGDIDWLVRFGKCA
jgi:hypothetical protein